MLPATTHSTELQSSQPPAGTPNQTLLQGRDEQLAKAEVGVLAAILLVATTGNLAVLLVVCRPARKLSRMHLFVLHLALSDLGVALFQVLPQMLWEVTYRFVGPDLLCRAVKYLQVLSMFASTYMLMAMTLDRYVAVCHPLRALRQPGRQPCAMVGAAWLLSCLLSTPQLFIFSLREVKPGSGVLDCWADFGYPWGARAYITWTTLCIFLLPVGILTACYSLICREISSPSAPCCSQKGSQCPSGQPSRVSSVRTISRAKIRTVKMTFVIVVAYVACWAPFFTLCVFPWVFGVFFLASLRNDMSDKCRLVEPRRHPSHGPKSQPCISKSKEASECRRSSAPSHLPNPCVPAELGVHVSPRFFSPFLIDMSCPQISSSNGRRLSGSFPILVQEMLQQQIAI
uniref:Arginine vasopressin receptor 1B n=1 Tax=Coturnix japonica TaxID=93934 RepID=A0A8C2TTI8_COTJA